MPDLRGSHHGDQLALDHEGLAMTIFWVDPQGVLIKATDDSQTISGATAVTVPPDSARHQTWDGATWVDNPDRAAKEQRSTDLAALRQAGKDISLVLTELVDWQLANTTMQASDFTPQVKQAYLDLKVIADRVKT